MPSPTFSTASTAKSEAPSSSACNIRPGQCSDYDTSDSKDAEQDLKTICHGWPALVDVMVKYRSFESFQAFPDLNIKSLLYYQAELVALRSQLHELEWQDHRTPGKASIFCGNVQSLLLSRYSTEKEKEEGANAQLEKMKEIREVLKEYNAALLQYTQINELPAPETFNVKTLRKWIDANIKGNLMIFGPGADSWGALLQHTQSITLWTQFGKLLRSIFCEDDPGVEILDLVVPHKSRNEDTLTRWVKHHGLPFWHSLNNSFGKTKTYTVIAPIWRTLRHPFRRQEKKDEDLPGPNSPSSPASPGIPAPKRTRTHSNASTFSTLKRLFSFERAVPAESINVDDPGSLTTYKMKGLIRFTNYVATIIACLLPIVGIVVLSKLHTRSKILGFIALFTAIFAIVIMLSTDATTKRTEIFTATAAFAAVLVVFVHNQNPGG